MIQMPASTRAIFDVVRAGNALDTSILGNVTDIRSQMEQAIAALPPPAGGSEEDGSGSAGEDPLAQARDQLNSLLSEEGMFASLQSHLQNQFTNLPRNLNLYVSNFGLNQGLGNLPQFPTIPPIFGAGGVGSETVPQSIGDICAGINDFFGSLIGQAQEFLQEIGNFIGQLLQQITALIEAIAQGVSELIQLATDAISAVVSQIMDVASQVTEMIGNEIARIQEALAEALSFVDALSFQNIFTHPCAKTVLGAVGSGALIAALTQG